MQERKKYTVELTAEQFDKFQTLIILDNCTRDIVFEEVKEETTIDEREETIKYFKCWAKCVDGCYEDCKKCEYKEDMNENRANEIALKHIQGYQRVVKWLGSLKNINPSSDYVKGFYKAIEEVKTRIEKEFDISEVDYETEIN